MRQVINQLIGIDDTVSVQVARVTDLWVRLVAVVDDQGGHVVRQLLTTSDFFCVGFPAILSVLEQQRRDVLAGRVAKGANVGFEFGVCNGAGVLGCQGSDSLWLVGTDAKRDVLLPIDIGHDFGRMHLVESDSVLVGNQVDPRVGSESSFDLHSELIVNAHVRVIGRNGKDRLVGSSVDHDRLFLENWSLSEQSHFCRIGEAHALLNWVQKPELVLRACRKLVRDRSLWMRRIGFDRRIFLVMGRNVDFHFPFFLLSEEKFRGVFI